MNLFSRLFGGIKMTWLRLVLFSIVIGVLVGVIMVIPAFKENAIREIGVGYECWIILAVFVVCNCSSTLDAGLKCFVFFLISQPLIYLVQQPFASQNLLASYYFPWFIKTLFTFPGGMIAYQVKRKDWIGTFILAIAGAALGIFGGVSVMGGIFSKGLSYVIYGAFCIAAAAGGVFLTGREDGSKSAFSSQTSFGTSTSGNSGSKSSLSSQTPSGSFKNKNGDFASGRQTKRQKALYLLLILAAVIGGVIFGYQSYHGGECVIFLESGHTWTIEETETAAQSMTAAVQDGTTMKITYTGSSAKGVWILSNENGEQIEVSAEFENGKTSTSIDEISDQE